MAATNIPNKQAPETEVTTIRFPDGLWTKARRAALDMRVPANQLVVEGLDMRLAKIRKETAEVGHGNKK